MAILSVLKTLSLVEWMFWGITIFFSIKGYMEYPNVLNKSEKESKSYSSASNLQR
ncbi:hypothetical protein [Marinisporobacter balticus]|uniref:Uncharacterized protein n=1 Tax=Marinisporobacter balticus TaxID=2018667 RepID=A0A4R2L5C8_9FIRM|nr:hypothetical protein [Marinisporobacter balticus]TCO79219.1 hypothetical protein EV214_103272 [Marinisporobacter balticus]